MNVNPYLETLKTLLVQKVNTSTKAGMAWNDVVTTKILSILTHLFRWPQSSVEWTIVILTIAPFFYFKPLRNLLYLLFTGLERKSIKAIQFLRKDWFGITLAIFLLWKLPILFFLTIACQSKKLLSFLTVFACGSLLIHTPSFLWWIITGSMSFINVLILTYQIYWKVKFGDQLWNDIKLYFQLKGKYVDETSNCSECGYSAVPIFKNQPDHRDGISEYCPQCGSLQEKSPWIDSEGNTIAWHMQHSSFTGESNKRYNDKGEFDPKTPENGEEWVKKYKEKNGKSLKQWLFEEEDYGFILDDSPLPTSIRRSSRRPQSNNEASHRPSRKPDSDSTK